MSSRGFLLEDYLLEVYIIIISFFDIPLGFELPIYCNNLSVDFHVIKAILGLLFKVIC